MTLTRGASTSAEDRQADAAIDIARRLRRIETVGHRHPDGPYLPLSGGAVSGTVTFNGLVGFTQPRTQFPLVDIGLSSVHGTSWGGMHWRANGHYLIMSEGTTTLISTPSTGGNIELRAGQNGGYKFVAAANGQHQLYGDLNLNSYYLKLGQGSVITFDSDTGLYSTADGIFDLRANGATIETMRSDGKWQNQVPIFLYNYPDTNHSLSYSTGPNGAVLQGYAGGWLTTAAGGFGNPSLAWNSSRDVAIGRNLSVPNDLTVTQQINGGRNQQAYGSAWNYAGFLQSPGAGTASMAFHPGGVAPQFRVANNDMTIYVRDTGGVSPSNISAAACVSTSSRRYKRNISPWPGRAAGAAVQGALDLVAQLAPHTYQWAHDVVAIPEEPRRLAAYLRLQDYSARSGKPEYELPVHDCATHACTGTAEAPCKLVLEHQVGKIGLMAEDTYRVLPQAVTLTTENLPDGIDYAVVTAVLVAAVQELTARVAQLEGVTG